MNQINTDSYPEKGKKIDICNKDSNYIVKVDASTDSTILFYEYSLSFYNAAHLIASYLLESERTSTSDLDTYFFSLAFLYRHSIELIMKAIAFQTMQKKEERVNFIEDTFHNLEEILKSIEVISQTQRPDNEMQWLHSYFADISIIDKESDSFRYPFHIVRETTDWFENPKFTLKRVFDKQTHIDLVKFANKFEVAYEILEKWYNCKADKATNWIDLLPVFIEEGGYFYGQSVVGYAYNRDDFYPYTKAYLDTANYLKQYMKGQCDIEKSKHVENLFLPMSYLYRNCVELNLKAIWFNETGESFQLRCKKMLHKKHSIIGIWKLIRPCIVNYATSSNNDLDYINILEDYCNQLHSLDCDGSKFRYPVQKDMQPYFKNNRRFDFWVTGVFLEALNNGLDGVYYAISYMNECLAQMEAEYRF